MNPRLANPRPRPRPASRLTPRLMPNHPLLTVWLANPGRSEPAQYPAPRPVIDPIPLGPVPSPNGILLTSSPLVPLPVSPSSKPPAAARSGFPRPQRHDVGGITGRAKVRRFLYHYLERHLPLVTVAAAEAAFRQFVVAAFNPYSLAVEQGIGHFLPGR